MKYVLFIIAALLLLLIGFIFGQRSVPPCPEPVTSIEVGKVDLPEVVKEIKKPKPVKSYKKTMAKSTMVDSTMAGSGTMAHPCDSINEYLETMEDSTGKVTVKSVVHGTMVSQLISFKPTISYIKETKTVDKPVPQRGLFIGIEAGTNLNLYRIAPEIEYLTKSGYAYSYNYDLINSIHSVGIKRRIKF